MTEWVAIAYGALDMREWHESHFDVEIMLVGVFPSEPFGLVGEYAHVWRRLLDGPVADSVLTAEESQLVREYEEAGIASRDPNHPARLRKLEAPWFTSPLHELVYALAAGVARDNGIDLVFIKGPVLHRQGLRDRVHSGDVDIWVSPQSIARLSRHLESWGWAILPSLWGDSPSYHSLALRPEIWGSEIDLHRHMPGCAMSDISSFKVLLSHSHTLEFAGISALVPDPHAHAVISALHLLRPQQLPGGTIAMSREVEAVETLRAGGAGSVEFADEIRATAVLEPALRLAFPEAEVSVDYEPPVNWRWRAERNSFRRYLMALRLVPIFQRPKAIIRLVWPEASTALFLDEMHGGGARSAFEARVRRLARWFSAPFRRVRG